jgi:hypothetical protein
MCRSSQGVHMLPSTTHVVPLAERSHIMRASQTLGYKTGPAAGGSGCKTQVQPHQSSLMQTTQQ